MKHSYTSADQWPLKLARNADIIKSLPVYVPPYHVMLYPTNKCNRNCSFCCSGNRDKTLEFKTNDLLFKMQKLGEYGARSVSIAGGGEPLLHPEINQIIHGLWMMGLKVGIVTNGDYLNTLDERSLGMLTYVRISASDEYKFDPKWWLRIAQPIVTQNPYIGWSFSYVLTKKFDHSNLNDYIFTADKFKFSHIRVVRDVLDPNVPDDSIIETKSKRVIWQPRRNPPKGAKECWVSLLRPLLAPDGYVYPCCGIQFAHDPPVRDNPETFRMGPIPRPWVDQKPFPGEMCDRCDYSEYNDYISLIKSEVQHEDFI